ncbi:transcriptional regulator, BadM/Rrf2 family [Cyclonatronum proteinivorum]|uniref:Transcriptional regulator, BadM/Rrf2 family n=1 Tax=Cyclonatronum proteinivorum TaxID=1457365 RepID=A0A345UHV4_9BACT|nr:Rrf2 family transcriptional regulator [Cyclonatronum proteinivorum]AXJ00056.1 transcriptional regulator, BadM/Rrf2 family [Cyclonatronum proteinivorum]
MLLSKSCIYGIRAALYIAARHEEDRKFVPIREVSDNLDLSFHFLTKILQQLTTADILKSYKGPNGGVAFTRSPEQIKMIDIIGAIDGYKLFTECILGLPGCGDGKPCPIHDKWGETRETLKVLFETTSLDELVKKGIRLNLRLSDTHTMEDILKGLK